MCACQYREYAALASNKDAETTSATKNKESKANTSKNSASGSGVNGKRKMTFKEKREFEQLEKDIDALTEEKKLIETELSNGNISVDRITELSKRLPVLNEELDEKEMRWLELSEIA